MERGVNLEEHLEDKQKLKARIEWYKEHAYAALCWMQQRDNCDPGYNI